MDDEPGETEKCIKNFKMYRVNLIVFNRFSYYMRPQYLKKRY
jgi:hypothetical protein